MAWVQTGINALNPPSTGGILGNVVNAALPNAITPEQNLAIARSVGFEGVGGHGNIDRYLLQNPDKVAEFTQARRQFQPGFSFNRENVAAARGVDLNAAPPPGVRPIGVVEPLNAIQRNALTNLAQGAPALGFMKGAAGALRRAEGMIQPFDASQELQNFLNPFTRQVTDVAIGDIQQQGDVLRNKIKQRSNQFGAFGGGRAALQQSQLDKNILDQIARTSAQTGERGFNTALQGAFQQSQIPLRQAQALQGIASGFSGLSGQNLGQFLRSQGAAFGAGGIIQQQNQSMLDAIQRERELQIGDPQSRINQYASVLGTIPTAGQSQAITQPGVGTAQAAIGGGLAGLGAAQQLGYNPFNFSNTGDTTAPISGGQGQDFTGGGIGFDTL